VTPDQASLAAILAEIDRSGMPRTPKDYARLAARTALIKMRGKPRPSGRGRIALPAQTGIED
jgi:hypothetical protein